MNPVLLENKNIGNQNETSKLKYRNNDENEGIFPFTWLLFVAFLSFDILFPICLFSIKVK